jgi:four helix bundle protein
MSVKSYEDWEVWQLGVEIAEITYRLTQNFPPEEIYGLRLRMRKASVSIPSNIAEGHERESTKEFLNFLSIARGSLGKLKTQYLLSVRLRYIKQEDFQPLSEKINVLGRKQNNLCKSLRAMLSPPAFANLILAAEGQPGLQSPAPASSLQPPAPNTYDRLHR